MIHEKEYRRIAQSLYESYSTHLPEQIIRTLLNNYSCSYFLESNGCKTARQCLDDFIMRYYPNEACIKANFIDKVLLKQGPTSVTIFELPVGSSRVDLCKINGQSSAYEIKTELDSFDRLEKQLYDYSRVFESTYLILPFKSLGSIPDYVSQSCGIYSYRQKKNGSYTFKLQRSPEQNRCLDSQLQLSTLSKVELASMFGYESSISKDEMIAQCLAQEPLEIINKTFKRALKARYNKRWNYLKSLCQVICKVDYEWFFHNNLDPALVY